MIYKTIQGDNWDLIAKKVYNNEFKADVLMQNNFNLLDYFIFPAGIELSVPELTEEELTDGLPDWRVDDET